MAQSITFLMSPPAQCVFRWGGTCRQSLVTPDHLNTPIPVSIFVFAVTLHIVCTCACVCSHKRAAMMGRATRAQCSSAPFSICVLVTSARQKGAFPPLSPHRRLTTQCVGVCGCVCDRVRWWYMASGSYKWPSFPKPLCSPLWSACRRRA